jgi:hypothetical protein
MDGPQRRAEPLSGMTPESQVGFRGPAPLLSRDSTIGRTMTTPLCSFFPCGVRQFRTNIGSHFTLLPGSTGKPKGARIAALPHDQMRTPKMTRAGISVLSLRFLLACRPDGIIRQDFSPRCLQRLCSALTEFRRKRD